MRSKFYAHVARHCRSYLDQSWRTCRRLAFVDLPMRFTCVVASRTFPLRAPYFAAARSLSPYAESSSHDCHGHQTLRRLFAIDNFEDSDRGHSARAAPGL